MKHTKKFEHSVNVLLKAYLNDTLEHGNCFACDPGYGAYRNMWSNGMRHKWNSVFVTTGKPGSKRQEIDGPYYRDAEIHEIDLATVKSSKALFV